MSSFNFDMSALIHVAALIQVAGFMIINQLRLRLMVLIATGLNITYYLTLNPPMWTSMFWAVVLGIVNTLIIVKLLLDRSLFNLSQESRVLYKVFDSMTPGEFRKLLKITHWHTASDMAILTAEGESVDHLFYVMSGPVEISKQGEKFEIEGNAFIGEVAFFLGSVASATVTVNDQARYVRWDQAALKALQKKDPGIRAALHSILNKDMAAKVAGSMGTAAIA